MLLELKEAIKKGNVKYFGDFCAKYKEAFEKDLRFAYSILEEVVTSGDRNIVKKFAQNDLSFDDLHELDKERILLIAGSKGHDYLQYLLQELKIAVSSNCYIRTIDDSLSSRSRRPYFYKLPTEVCIYLFDQVNLAQKLSDKEKCDILIIASKKSFEFFKHVYEKINRSINLDNDIKSKILSSSQVSENPEFFEYLYRELRLENSLDDKELFSSLINVANHNLELVGRLFETPTISTSFKDKKKVLRKIAFSRNSEEILRYLVEKLKLEEMTDDKKVDLLLVAAEGRYSHELFKYLAKELKLGELSDKSLILNKIRHFGFPNEIVEYLIEALGLEALDAEEKYKLFLESFNEGASFDIFKCFFREEEYKAILSYKEKRYDILNILLIKDVTLDLLEYIYKEKLLIGLDDKVQTIQIYEKLIESILRIHEQGNYGTEFLESEVVKALLEEIVSKEDGLNYLLKNKIALMLLQGSFKNFKSLLEKLELRKLIDYLGETSVTFLLERVNSYDIELIQYLFVELNLLKDLSFLSKGYILQSSKNKSLEFFEYLFRGDKTINSLVDHGRSARDIQYYALESELEVSRYILMKTFEGMRDLNQRLQYVDTFYRYINSPRMIDHDSQEETGKAVLLSIFSKEILIRLSVSRKNIQDLHKSLIISQSPDNIRSACNVFDVYQITQGDSLNAFQASTNPLPDSIKKVIILDQKSLSYLISDYKDGSLSLDQLERVITFFIDSGFTLFIAHKLETADEITISPVESFADCLRNLEFVAEFDLDEGSLKQVLRYKSSSNATYDSIISPDPHHILLILALTYVGREFDVISKDDDFSEKSCEISDLFKILLRFSSLVNIPREKDSRIAKPHRPKQAISLANSDESTAVAGYTHDMLKVSEGRKSSEMTEPFSPQPANSLANSGESTAVAGYTHDMVEVGEGERERRKASEMTEPRRSQSSGWASFMLDMFKLGKRRKPSQSTKRATKVPGAIYSARSKKESEEVSDVVNPRYDMVKVGEGLNVKVDDFKPRTMIRNINISDFNITFTEKIPDESSLTEITDYDFIDDEGKYRKKTQKKYYKFNTIISANRRTRLFSVGTEDKFIGIIGYSIPNLVIEKDDDGFFWARIADSKLDAVEISYIICDSTHSNIITNSLEVKEEIIRDYKSPEKGFHKSTVGNQIIERNGDNSEDWLRRVYDLRSGSCTLRVAAVYYKIISTYPEQETNVRIARMANNHVVLEMRHNPTSSWVKFDLGGTRGELNHDNADAPYEIRTKRLSEDSHDQDLKDSIKERLQAKTNVGICDSTDIYSQIANKKKVLLLTEQIDKVASLLARDIREQRSRVFYLNSPQQIFGERMLKVSNHDKSLSHKIAIAFDNEFKDFISSLPSDVEFYLIIDWSKFDAKQIVSLNSMLDKVPNFNGKDIKGCRTIISLVPQLPKDPSFLSRHNSILQYTNRGDEDREAELSSETTLDLEETIIIDLKRSSKWQEELFGAILMEEDCIMWYQSEFVKGILEGKKKFIIENVNLEVVEEIRAKLDFAKSLGHIRYCGYEILLPEDITIEVKSDELNFSRFNDFLQQQKIYQDLTLSDVIRATDDRYILVNNYIFEYLLRRNKVEDSRYEHEVGFIEENQNGSLNLFITSTLSDEQYYVLFINALKFNVALNIFLAPGVLLPNDLNIKYQEKTTLSSGFTSISSGVRPRVIVSNDPNQAAAEILQETIAQDIDAKAISFEDAGCFVIDVEDYNYQQLFDEITFEFASREVSSPDESRNPFSFDETYSDFVSELDGGQRNKIILKGKFDRSFLQTLHLIICNHDPKYNGILGNLVIIIEDQNSSSRDFADLRFLGDAVEVKSYEKEELEKTDPLDIDDIAIDDSDSKDFNETRLDNLKKILKGNIMVQLVGHSGVGKSSLLQDLSNQADSAGSVYRVFFEEGDIERWAESSSNDSNDTVTNILFIDEANLEASHLTKFASLKRLNLSDPSKIVGFLHNKKLYYLDNSHRIIFAKNPITYSNARYEQKLLADVVEVEFSEFSSEYIYNNILKAQIYDQYPSYLLQDEDEVEFRALCDREIATFQKSNAQQRESGDESKCSTIRELQERILLEAWSLESPKSDFVLKTPGFISTKATNAVEDSLFKAINIRQNMRSNVNSGRKPKAIGLNGCIIEGDPGLGKSELIAAVLEQKGITQKSIDATKSDESNQQYYQLKASDSPEKKSRIMIQAFEEGNIVWIDEINSCIDSAGLEKILNSVLSANHPVSPGTKVKPGFMLISSINPPFLPGRSQLSPAIKHRCQMLKYPNITEYSIHDLEQIASHQISQLSDVELVASRNDLGNLSKAAAAAFKEHLSSQEKPTLNFRDFAEVLASVYEERFPPAASPTLTITSKGPVFTQQKR